MQTQGRPLSILYTVTDNNFQQQQQLSTTTTTTTTTDFFRHHYRLVGNKTQHTLLCVCVYYDHCMNVAITCLLHPGSLSVLSRPGAPIPPSFPVLVLFGINITRLSSPSPRLSSQSVSNHCCSSFSVYSCPRLTVTKLLFSPETEYNCPGSLLYLSSFY